MKILVTSGGTEEAIDDVRFIGNRSTGALGALLAEEAVRRFHEVDLLAGRSARSPAAWALDTGLLRMRRYTDSDDLWRHLDQRLRLLGAGAVIHAAAVADFRPVPVPGKIASADHEVLNLRLERAPKLAPRIRDAAPDATVVVFKLEAVDDRGVLFARARRTLAASRADFVVANPVAALGEGAHPAWVLTADDVLAEVGTKAALVEALLELLEGSLTGSEGGDLE
ncbi:MAG: phosphopantothenoylcysteine decarboxylase [Pseudomonadota bacterium]